MTTIGLVGGSGALAIAGAGSEIAKPNAPPAATPYGEPSSPVLHWERDGVRFRFIARHGLDGSIPPHLVNYRANIWTLHEQAPEFVIGLNAVGGIASWATPGRLVFPEQLIDYTWGRDHTFADARTQPLQHIEFSVPFSRLVRARLEAAAVESRLDFHPGGVYGVTQGPRLETAAEIDRMARDGCDIVGMTAMPEAALAREVGLHYGICAVVVNRAAGRGPAGAGIHEEMARYIDAGMAQAGRLLAVLRVA